MALDGNHELGDPGHVAVHNEIDEAIATKASIVALEAEEDRAQDAEQGLAMAISAETDRAQEVEEGLTTDLANEVVRATQAETSLAGSLGNEVTARQAAIIAEAESRTAAIGVEAAAREAANAATLTSAQQYADSHDATTLASAKTYSDSHDATTLTTAQQYADSHDATILASAQGYADAADADVAIASNEYTDTEVATLKTYVDSHDATTLASANTNAASGDATTLSSANNYADNAVAETLVDAKAYTDTEVAVAETTLNTALDTAVDTLEGTITSTASTTLESANEHADDGDAATLTAAEGYADTGDTNTLAAAATDATTKANSALASANAHTNTEVAAEVAARTQADTNLQNTLSDAITDADADIRSDLGATISTLDAAALKKSGAQTATGLTNFTGGLQVNSIDVASKSYVDSASQGLRPFDLGGVNVATLASLPANTRTNNVLTANANGALPAIDGEMLAVNDTVLVKDEATGANNGVYVVTALGDGSNPWVLTRRSDADSDAEMVSGKFTIPAHGTQANNTFFLATDNPITLNTTALEFVSLGGANQIVAGAGLNRTGNTLDVVLGPGGVADDDTVVHLAGAETISGNKNFTGALQKSGVDVATTQTVDTAVANINSALPATIDTAIDTSVPPIVDAAIDAAVAGEIGSAITTATTPLVPKWTAVSKSANHPLLPWEILAINASSTGVTRDITINTASFPDKARAKIKVVGMGTGSQVRLLIAGGARANTPSTGPTTVTLTLDGEEVEITYVQATNVFLMTPHTSTSQMLTQITTRDTTTLTSANSYTDTKVTNEINATVPALVNTAVSNAVADLDVNGTFPTHDILLVGADGVSEYWLRTDPSGQWVLDPLQYRRPSFQGYNEYIFTDATHYRKNGGSLVTYEGDISLASNEDALIWFPSTQKLGRQGGDIIVGGRNVAVIGGEFRQDTDVFPLAQTDHNPATARYRTLYLNNQTGNIWLEGLQLHGTRIGDAFVFNHNNTNNCDITMQHCLIGNLNGGGGPTAASRAHSFGMDDGVYIIEPGTGNTYDEELHADCMQFQSVNSTEMDPVRVQLYKNIWRTAYQGFLGNQAPMRGLVTRHQFIEQQSTTYWNGERGTGYAYGIFGANQGTYPVEVGPGSVVYMYSGDFKSKSFYPETHPNASDFTYSKSAYVDPIWKRNDYGLNYAPNQQIARSAMPIPLGNDMSSLVDAVNSNTDRPPVGGIVFWDTPNKPSHILGHDIWIDA